MADVQLPIELDYPYILDQENLKDFQGPKNAAAFFWYQNTA